MKGWLTILISYDFSFMLDQDSLFGGCKIEGVVIKPVGYVLYGEDKKALLGKFVSEVFKETHQQSWKESNPSNKDVLDRLAKVYGTQARWLKATQHLRESGQLENSPRDIGNLLKEVVVDVEKECKEEIMQKLWEHSWPSLRRMLTGGLPEWWKEKLLREQFEQTIEEGAKQEEGDEG